jgi:hypothetical protein
LKFDARDGRFARVDRVEDSGQWRSENTEIDIKDMEFVADLERLEVGWVCFPTGQAPEFHMVPIGKDIGDPPGDKFKEGFRLKVKLQNGAGNDVREFASTAAGLWDSVDELHDEYLAGKDKHRNKLPVVGVHEMIRRDGRQTTYRPSFEILKWVPRPADLT